MKRNDREQFIVAQRMRNAATWQAEEPAKPGKLRKTRVAPKSEKAITRWDEDGLHRNSKRYAFNLQAELEQWGIEL